MPWPATARAVSASRPKMLAIHAEEKPSSTAILSWSRSTLSACGLCGSVRDVPIRMWSSDPDDVHDGREVGVLDQYRLGEYRNMDSGQATPAGSGRKIARKSPGGAADGQKPTVSKLTAKERAEHE